jgi:Co/Zn/Cd efflux system component
MGNIIAGMIVYAFLIVLSFYVARTWVRWLRSKVKLTEPRWRSGTTVFGFALTIVSLLLIVALAVHSLITGGLSYYHPTLMRAMRIGVLTALAGMVAAFIGTGQLENPAIAVSGLGLLIWFVEGIAQ